LAEIDGRDVYIIKPSELTPGFELLKRIREKTPAPVSYHINNDVKEDAEFDIPSTKGYRTLILFIASVLLTIGVLAVANYVSHEILNTLESHAGLILFIVLSTFFVGRFSVWRDK